MENRKLVNVRCALRTAAQIPRMWFYIAEDLLTPEPALPAQVHDIWHHTCAITPERELALAVFWQAVIDLSKYRFARRRREQRLFIEAYEWVVSDDRSWPYSFVNLCEAFSLAPAAVRCRVLDDTTVAELHGPFRSEEAA